MQSVVLQTVASNGQALSSDGLQPMLSNSPLKTSHLFDCLDTQQPQAAPDSAGGLVTE